eukprot:2707003-Prymnesium_polylepis.1
MEVATQHVREPNQSQEVGWFGTLQRRRTEARRAARARLHSLAQLDDHLGGVADAPRRLDVGAVLDRRADEARLDEGVDEAVVILVEDRLDTLRERLHDLWLHPGHQPEVEEHERAVVLQHEVALVRVGVDEARHDQARRDRLDRHVRHAQPLRLREAVEVAPLHPLGHNHPRPLE